jgi:predicted ester cyclase
MMLTKTNEESTMTMTTSTPPIDKVRTAKEIVLAFYDDFDGGRLARSETVAPEFEATVFGTTVLDLDGFVGFGQGFLDAFSDGRHEFDFVVAEGDAVATIGHYRGTHDGVLMGVAATGNQVDMVVMHVDRVSDGRIVEHRGIGDINAMWAQLGVRPPDA